MPNVVITHPRKRVANARTGSPGPVARGYHGATACPEPAVDRVRGPRLVLIWIALAAGSWAIVGGVGYGLYSLAVALAG